MPKLDDLNANQRLVAEWGEGPLLVIGGSGSGKTLALTLRMIRLIEETPKKRFRVLGLTFTSKAVDDMQRQVIDRLGRHARRPRPTTFHAYAASILSWHGGRMGLHPDVTLMTEDRGRMAFLGRAVARTGATIPSDWSDRGLLRRLEVLMAKGDDPELDDRAGEDARVWSVYGAYLDLMTENNCLDPGSSLILCRRLFRKRPIFAQDQRLFYPFLFVDGYEHLNRAQYRFLRTIHSDRNANLVVAVDDDRPVSDWDGATPERLRRLAEDYDLRVVRLPRNRRCPEPVVRRANGLLRQDEDVVLDEGSRMPGAAETPEEGFRVLRFADEREEARWLAGDLKAKADPGACAVLARSHRLVETVAEALRDAGVPVAFEETTSQFESPVLRVVRSALDLAQSPAHAERLAALCRAYGELAGGDLDPGTVEAESALTGKPLLDAFVGLAESNGGAGSGPVVAAIREQVLEKHRPARFASAVFDWADREFPEPTGNGNHSNLAWEIRSWRALNGQTDPSDSDRTPPPRKSNGRSGSSPATGSGVRCLTLDGARGLEFEQVYLAGLAEGELPSFRAVERGAEAVREERRACFRAITRTSGSVFLTHADSYFGWVRQPSRFLAELEVDVRSGAGLRVERPGGLSAALSDDLVAEGS